MGLFGRMYQSLYEGAAARYKKEIVKMIGRHQEPVDLLDCGCDDGQWTLELAKSLPGARLHGVEIVPEAAAQARQQGIAVESFDLNGPFPYASNTFDIVHANQLFEHLHDTDRFLSEVFRVLKPGGELILCTENLSSWHNVMSLVMGWQPFSLTNITSMAAQIGNPLALHKGAGGQRPASWQHVRVMALGGLKGLLIAHGYKITRVAGAGYFPLPGWLGSLDKRHASFIVVAARKFPSP